MNIFKKISEIFTGRLNKTGLLLIYDDTKSQLFYKVAASIHEADPRVALHDAGIDPIAARKAAGQFVHDGMNGQFMLFAPYAIPVGNDAKSNDPYYIFGLMGSVFPSSGADSYLQIALQADTNQQFQSEIRRLFESFINEPDFEMVDAVMSGNGEYPLLRKFSGKKTEPELLQWLLTTSADVAVEKSFSEVRHFVLNVCGMTLPEKNIPISQLQADLWERVLLSDWIGQLGSNVPGSLASVEVAPDQGFEIIDQALNSLRDSKDDALYKEMADRTEAKVGAQALLADIDPAECMPVFRCVERQALHQAIQAVLNGNAELGNKLLNAHAKSLWAIDEEYSMQWDLLDRAMSLCAEVSAMEKYSGVGVTRDGLIEFYATTAYKIDSAARKFEEHYQDYIGSINGVNSPDSDLKDLFEKLHKFVSESYLASADKLHKQFLRSIVKEGWGQSRFADNASIFDTNIKPILNIDGRSIALIIVDGLRYEMAVLLKDLLEKYKPDLKPACARFPTITSVGKACHLPNAQKLRLRNAGGRTLVPVIDGVELPGLSDRMRVLQNCYGQRFKEMTTDAFLNSRAKLDPKINLLVLRNDEIDQYLENNKSGLLSSVKSVLNQIARAVLKIEQTTNITDAFIVTDHGFCLNFRYRDSQSCAKPEGDWINVHERMLLGSNSREESSNIVMDADRLGIAGDFMSVAFPISLTCYAVSRYYFHGGVSLQEAVVPVMAFRISRGKSGKGATPLEITLKPKKKKTTSLVCRVFIQREGDLFTAKDDIAKVLITVSTAGFKDTAGDVIDSDTNLVTLIGTEEQEIRIKLNPECFHEPRTVIVRALNPTTKVCLADTSFSVEVMS